MPYLPHLLGSHQHRLLRHFPQPRLRLRLPRGRLLEPGARVRKRDKHGRRDESNEIGRGTSHSLSQLIPFHLSLPPYPYPSS